MMEECVLGELWIDAEHRMEMETYFMRNLIPAKIQKVKGMMLCYGIREGRDLEDAMIYYDKRFGDLEDPDVLNRINFMVLMRQYGEPEYEYECMLPKRVDEKLLSSFV